MLVEHVHRADSVTSVFDRAVVGINSNGPWLTVSPRTASLPARISSQQTGCRCERPSGGTVICLSHANISQRNKYIRAKSIRPYDDFYEHLTYCALCTKAIAVILSPHFNYVSFY